MTAHIRPDLATIPANLAGVPGISVPNGLADEDDLPSGFQVLAPALADEIRLLHQEAQVSALGGDGRSEGAGAGLGLAIVREFVRGGYAGFFSSEWEGHAFADLGEADPIDLVKKQHALMRRAIEQAVTARV